MQQTAQAQEIPAVPEPLRYDAREPQSFTFEVEDSANVYETTFVFGGITDAALTEFDRLREVSLNSKGATTDVVTDSSEADQFLFDTLCVDVKGFDGERPDNWLELIPIDEKRAAIAKLLAFRIEDSKTNKRQARRQWGAAVSPDTIALKSHFGHEIVETSATFRTKTPADVAAYAVIRARVSLVDRSLDDQAIKIPASMAKKAALFDKLAPETTGYAEGGVPLHHKAAFVTAFFEARISDAEKK